jgi:hypothetical protein
MAGIPSSRILVISTASALATVVAIVAIVWFVFGISNAHEAFAPPTTCIACATKVEGDGFGTITIPENAEIAPQPCDACFASISFDAETNGKGQVQNGTITIDYTDSEGVTQTLSGEFYDGRVGKDSFRLLGTIIQGPTTCDACGDVDFVLSGKIVKGSFDSATLTFRAVDGTQATFDNAKVTITTIPSEA